MEGDALLPAKGGDTVPRLSVRGRRRPCLSGLAPCLHGPSREERKRRSEATEERWMEKTTPTFPLISHAALTTSANPSKHR